MGETGERERDVRVVQHKYWADGSGTWLEEISSGIDLLGFTVFVD